MPPIITWLYACSVACPQPRPPKWGNCLPDWPPLRTERWVQGGGAASPAFKPRNCLGECKGRDEVSVRFLPCAAGRSDVPAVGTWEPPAAGGAFSLSSLIYLEKSVRGAQVSQPRPTGGGIIHRGTSSPPVLEGGLEEGRPHMTAPPTSPPRAIVLPTDHFLSPFLRVGKIPWRREWLPCSPRGHKRLEATWLFNNNSRCIYVSTTFSTRPILSFPHYVHRSDLYVCISVPSAEILSYFPATSP